MVSKTRGGKEKLARNNLYPVINAVILVCTYKRRVESNTNNSHSFCNSGLFAVFITGLSGESCFIISSTLNRIVDDVTDDEVGS